MARNLKVFCSHRSKDKPTVKEVAAKLAAAGIEPWLDEWEILPGSDFVAAINRGIETCDAGLVFFSNEVEAGKWVQAEISALTVQAIDDGKPLIPILLDPDVPVPPLLRARSRLGVDQIPELIDAIYGRTGKPRVAPPRTEVARRRFILSLRRVGPDEIAVAAELDGKPVGPEETRRLGAGFQFSYKDFLRSRPAYSRRPSSRDAADDSDRDLRNLGRALGTVLFPGAVDAALNGLLEHAASVGEEVQLIVETADSELLSIPLEAASLENGRVPCLEAGMTMFRHLIGCPVRMAAPRAGPLKILVAVGAPDENKTGNAVLDIERELHTILNAIEQAQRYGNAAVRILEVGSVEEIRSALAQQTYHVLHLSGHGQAGEMELEDEDGAPVRANAADLAAAVRESGRPAPLLFLASSHSGAGEGETASLAQGLLRQGIPAVVAMQSAVTDQYATSLAGAFYGHLCSESPVPSIALARARRDIERARRKAADRGEAGVQAEYAAPALFVAADEEALLDRRLDLEPLRAPVRQPLAGLVPMLRMDDLIGRRSELRRVVRVLLDDPRTVDEIGRKAGYQLCGMGGVGKSALAGRAIARMAELNWIVATVSGKWNLGQLALTIALALGDHAELADVARSLADPGIEDRSRMLLLGNLLAQRTALLVLDNFEDNLTVGGGEFLELAMAAVMEFLYRSAQRGKLLVTSRYPLPNSEGWLATEDLGPLSPAETRKLFLRMAGLRRQEPENLNLIQRVIGGHPRALEYLNAILNRGHARMPDVERRLRARAGELGLNLNERGVTVEEAVPRALKVAADDILLDELLDIFAADREVLFQASIFPMPVPASAVELCLAAAEGSLRLPLDRLAQSSLLTQLDGGDVWVHRWTAECLRVRMGEESFRERCGRGGKYLDARLAQSHSLIDGLEAVRLFLSAGGYDRAAEIGEHVLSFLERYGRGTDTAMLSREMVQGLPGDHPRRSCFEASEADALLSLGFTGEATARWQSIAATCEKLSREHPDRADYLQDLSVSYERMGDLMGRLGDGEQVRQFYQKALEHRERLVRQEPDRADYLRDLSASYERMGDLMGGLGDGERARQFYQKALEIRERLVRQEPDRADYLRGLSVSYDKMGELMGSLGEGKQARQFYQKMLEIAERLTQQEPDRADYLRDLSVSYERMGDQMGGLGKGEQVRQFYQKALEIREQLSGQEPDRADYLRDLSVSYIKMGDLMRSLDEGEQARQFYQKALEIRERLAGQELDRADYLRDLSVSYNKMGDVMGSLGEGEQARQFYQKALEIAERLVRQELDRADYLRDLSVSYNKMGDVMGSLGEGEQARQFYQKALEIAERLVRQEPDRADYLRDLSVSYDRMGDITGRLGEGEQAGQYYQKALEIRERLAGQEPDRADHLRDLSISYNKMGDLMGSLGEGEQAREYYQKALEIRERLAGQEPDRADHLRDLSISYNKMGDLMGSLSEGEQAREYYQKALTRISHRICQTSAGDTGK